MRAYDINLTIHINCVAHSEKEATDVVTERFRAGGYNDTDDTFIDMKVKEVE